MTGFRNFVLRATSSRSPWAFIMALAFAAVVTAFVAWLTSLMPDAVSNIFSDRAQPFGAFLNAVDLVRADRGRRLLLRRDALHQGQGALLPERGGGHAGRHRAARGDPRPAEPRATAPSDLIRGAAAPGRGTRSSRADSSPRPSEPGSRSSVVVSGSTSPNTSASRRVRSASRSSLVRARRRGRHAQSPLSRASWSVFLGRRVGRRGRAASGSADGVPVGEPAGAGRVGRRRRGRAGQAARALIASSRNRGASGLSLIIACQTCLDSGSQRMRFGSSGAYCHGHGDELDLVEADVLELRAELGDLHQAVRGPCRAVRDWVAASRNFSSRIGLARVLALSTWCAIAAMNACWRFIRPMSEPLPSTYRSRT